MTVGRPLELIQFLFSAIKLFLGSADFSFRISPPLLFTAIIRCIYKLLIGVFDLITGPVNLGPR